MHSASTDEMHVKMEDRLSAVGSRIHYQAIAVTVHTLFGSQLAGYGIDVADQSFILVLQVIEGLDMPVWDHKQMRGSYGVKIAKGRYQLVTIKYIGSCLIVDYLAEDTGLSAHGACKDRPKGLLERPVIGDTHDVIVFQFRALLLLGILRCRIPDLPHLIKISTCISIPIARQDQQRIVYGPLRN